MRDSRSNETTGYHLFFLPPDPLRSELELLIHSLAEKMGGPAFIPHVSLLSEIDSGMGEVEIIKKADLLVSTLQPFSLRFGRVGRDDAFFRSLFVCISESNELQKARTKAVEIFGMHDAAKYSPHLSLLYGDYSDTQKDEIEASLILPQDYVFSVSSLCVYKTQGRVEEWQLVAEIPFASFETRHARKQQIVAIHGGDTYRTYGEFFANAFNAFVRSIRFSGHPSQGWKKTLGAVLGDEYEVFLPRFPSPHNARYSEWKNSFEKLIPLIQDDVLLVGHSLGGSFLAKYLSENKFPKKIRATFLVAAPYDEDGDRSLASFTLPASLELFSTQSPQVFLYQSEDDPIVSFSELDKYKQCLPNAKVSVLHDRGHVIQSEFSEIVSDIRSLQM
jgi:predicted alpha/beta hydrolase family esterase